MDPEKEREKPKNNNKRMIINKKKFFISRTQSSLSARLR